MKKRNSSGLTGLENPGLELEMTEKVVVESEGPDLRSQTSRTAASVSGAVKAAAQWACYTCTRWRKVASQRATGWSHGQSLEGKYKGLAREEEEEEEEEEEGDEPDWPGRRRQLNKKLLDHFRELATSDQDTDQVDLQYVSDLISEGAEPNSADRYGQTVLHEISRAWSVDVMRFFLERGSDLHRSDGFGVTALHVAAALDYVEMVQFLLDQGAEVEAATLQDQQTPLHYAAKNDAVGAVRLLLEGGANIGCRDYKHRTPLQLAASVDRSEAAGTLLELGADAGVKDRDGQLCITALIGRMPPVAALALGQFHLKDRVTRRQYYHLNLLEPEAGGKHNTTDEDVVNDPMSPLEVIVHQGCLDLIMHPVVLKLIHTKWTFYGRLGAWLFLILNFLFIISWTTVAISVSALKDSEPYRLPRDWWRVLLLLLAVLLAGEEMLRELREMRCSRRRLRLWQRWSLRRLQDDLRRVHPMWPQESSFLMEQHKQINKMSWSYGRDLWNVFDWLVFSLLGMVLGLHMADIFLLSSTLRAISLRLFSITIIFLWLRLMKHVRAFRVMGPFIVMLGNIAGDVLRFLFLYADIYIPYACAFWIIFGGLQQIPSMQTFPVLLYSLYRITLVDEYQFDAMLTVDPTMAYLLCGTFLALSSVLCVNLFIALLSDTFQRVYDNALANGVMQQAAIILQVEEAMPFLRRYYDDEHIPRHCSPLAEFYDDDDHNTSSVLHKEMTQIATQFKGTLDEFLEIQKGTVASVQIQQAEQGSRGRCSPLVEQRKQQQQQEEVAAAVGAEQLRLFHQLLEQQEWQHSELRALRADLKELQNLLESLVQNRAGAVKVKGRIISGKNPNMEQTQELV